MPLPERGADGMEVGVVGLAGRGLAVFAGCSARADGFADFVAGIFAGVANGAAGVWVLVLGVDAAGAGFAVFAAFFVLVAGGNEPARWLFGAGVSAVAGFVGGTCLVVGEGVPDVGWLDVAGAFADFVADLVAGIFAGGAASGVAVFAGVLALSRWGASAADGDSAFAVFAGSRFCVGCCSWVAGDVPVVAVTPEGSAALRREVRLRGLEADTGSAAGCAAGAVVADGYDVADSIVDFVFAVFAAFFVFADCCVGSASIALGFAVFVGSPCLVAGVGAAVLGRLDVAGAVAAVA